MKKPSGIDPEGIFLYGFAETLSAYLACVAYDHEALLVERLDKLL